MLVHQGELSGEDASALIQRRGQAVGSIVAVHQVRTLAACDLQARRSNIGLPLLLPICKRQAFPPPFICGIHHELHYPGGREHLGMRSCESCALVLVLLGTTADVVGMLAGNPVDRYRVFCRKAFA